MVLCFMLVFSWISCSIAGSEDWSGTFTIKDSSGSVNTASHTPTYVQFSFIKVGKCLHLGKGSNLNGIEIKENVDLCTNSNIETFINEAQKLGLIVNQTITRGPSYIP